MVDGVLTGWISRGLKVPPEPEPPLGSPGSLRVFNAARGYYHYRLAMWGLKQLGTGIGLVVGLFVVMTNFEFGGLPFGRQLWSVVEVGGVALYLAQIPVSFLMVGLDYRYRWYMITDASLRIREGITTVRERTMTFANIQNLSLRQGPVQRLFGIADLQVRTAGGGGAETSSDGSKETSEADNMHLGYFRGVDNAEDIRDLILDRMRGLRDSGLGDPDDSLHRHPAGPSSTDDGDVAAAARDLLAEARALRIALGG